MRRIFDCFIFYNEIELLKYRFELLKDVVDTFIIVEANITFSGKPKEMYFKNFGFKNVIYKVVDLPFKNPTNEQVWENEKFQRNFMETCLEDILDDDILIFSDVDEIPDPETLKMLKDFKIDSIYSLEQDFYYYNLESKMNKHWYYSKLTDYFHFKQSKLSIDQIRWTTWNYIKRGGWHLSYFGEPSFISNKIQNFSHQEFNKPEFTDTILIKNRIENGMDLFSRSEEKITNIPLYLNHYLPPNFSKKIIGFHASGHLCERGTDIAMFDYAYYNQKLNGYSIIFYDLNNLFNNELVIKKFKKEFQVFGYNSFDEINNFNLDYFYNIKANNEKNQITKFQNLTHVVFEIKDIPSLENETISVISPVVNKNVLVVPHMINLPKIKESLKDKLGIPSEATVFGRHGGYNEFDIPFVYTAIKEILSIRSDIYFLFVNTKVFYLHSRIIYLPMIIDLDEKVMFINTCDAMIHARSDGETFGLSIGEFSSCNKPIITCYGTYNNHIELLKKSFIYTSKESLVDIFKNDFKNLTGDWNFFKDYTPEKVMETFNNVFLNEKVENGITLVTAFFDIGRSNWDKYTRSVEYYINSFYNYLKLPYKMVVFMDSRYHLHVNSNVTIIPIDLEFLEKNVDSWKYINMEDSIMKSENYKKLLGQRIKNGNPENIYPVYNIINHSKVDFLELALPYIKTNFVCWTDFGYHSSILRNEYTYPINDLDINRFNVSKINTFLVNKVSFHEPGYILQNAPDIFTGSFYGLPVKMVKTFKELYHNCLNELYQMSISDDDQHILLRCYYKNPDLFELHIQKEGQWPEALAYFQKTPDRCDLIKRYINILNPSICLEIGTDTGFFAEHILRCNENLKLYCVDPYSSYNDYHDGINNVTGDELYYISKNKLSIFGERVNLIRNYSHLAEIDETLDLLYIDANHAYKYVLQDLEKWYPKVRSGGVIIGDDAVDTDESQRNSENNVFINWGYQNCYGNYGVIKAFRDFVIGKNCKNFIIGNQYIILKD